MIASKQSVSVMCFWIGAFSALWDCENKCQVKNRSIRPEIESIAPMCYKPIWIQRENYDCMWSFFLKFNLNAKIERNGNYTKCTKWINTCKYPRAHMHMYHVKLTCSTYSTWFTIQYELTYPDNFVGRKYLGKQGWCRWRRRFLRCCSLKYERVYGINLNM